MWMHWAYKYLELYWSVCLQYWLVTGVTTKLNTTINQEMKISGQLRILNHKFSRSKKLASHLRLNRFTDTDWSAEKRKSKKFFPHFAHYQMYEMPTLQFWRTFFLDLKKLLAKTDFLKINSNLRYSLDKEINCTKRPFSFQLWKNFLFLSKTHKNKETY